MSQKMGSCKTFSRLAHISVVVKDMQESVDYYQSLGIGPFKDPENHVFPMKTLRGVPIDSELIIKETCLGTIKLQLVQHVRGNHIVKDFVDRKGYGVYHLGFLVDDIEEHEKEMCDRDVGVIQKGRRPDGSGYSYFDTEAKAGIILEIKSHQNDRR
jgi:catechol 2,3-dioxygenase-like lactoylglutathione lyase family enzyme